MFKIQTHNQLQLSQNTLIIKITITISIIATENYQ